MTGRTLAFPASGAAAAALVVSGLNPVGRWVLAFQRLIQVLRLGIIVIYPIYLSQLLVMMDT
jgi:hypothetical protein